jgi:putative toxin-antitoxin system antitoxin component (TIGR02293 family)
MTVSEQIAAVEQGMPYDVFLCLAKRLEVTEERLRNVLGFSAATLHRRKVGGRFNLDESNRLYWLECLLDTADQVFEDPGETQAFMTTGHLALGGAIPLDYTRTAPGFEAVRRLLMQFDHGVVI